MILFIREIKGRILEFNLKLKNVGLKKIFYLFTVSHVNEKLD